MEQERKELGDKYIALESEKKALAEHCEALEASGVGQGDRVPELEVRVKELEVENSELKGQLAGLEENVGVLTAEKSELSGRLAEVEGQVKALRETDAASSARLKELEAREESVVKEMKGCKDQLLKSEAAFGRLQKTAADQNGALQWLMKSGISFCVRSVLASPDFRETCRDLQSVSIRYGVDKGCRATHSRYESLLEGKPLVHSFPHAQAEAKTKFENMLTRTYPLMIDLESGKIGFLDLWKQAAEQEKKNRLKLAEEVARAQAEEEEARKLGEGGPSGG